MPKVTGISLNSYSFVFIDCKAGWSNFQGHCFKVIQTRINYESAKTSCQGENAILAEISSDLMNTFLVDLIARKCVLVILQLCTAL